MNNSKVILDSGFLAEEDILDPRPFLRERETELLELLDALDHIRSSDYWRLIQQKFADDLQKLINQLKSEKDTTELFRLQGRVTQAERLNLDKTAEEYRTELAGIRKQLHAQNN